MTPRVVLAGTPGQGSALTDVVRELRRDDLLDKSTGDAGVRAAMVRAAANRVAAVESYDRGEDAADTVR